MLKMKIKYINCAYVLSDCFNYYPPLVKFKLNIVNSLLHKDLHCLNQTSSELKN